MTLHQIDVIDTETLERALNLQANGVGPQISRDSPGLAVHILGVKEVSALVSVPTQAHLGENLDLLAPA